MNSPAIERIQFQVNIPLASSMISICQDAIDELKTSRKMDGDQVEKADSYRIQTATKALKKSFVPALEKLCKEELNLNTEITLLQDVVYLNAMTYTEYKEYSKEDTWMTIITGHNLFEGTQEYNQPTFDREYFQKHADDVDLEVSKLKKFTKEHLTYVWVWTTVFMSEEIVDPKVIAPLSAEEIAAVILHELGHAMTILEHMGDVYNRSEIATNTIKYLNEKANEITLITAVTDFKDTKEDPTPEITKAIDILNKIKNKISNFAPVIAIVVGYYMAYYILLITYLRINLGGKYANINLKFKKTSDTVVTKSNESYMERIADEFVSRHGLGRPLAEALARSHIWYEQGHQYTSMKDAVYNLGYVKTVLLSYKTVLDFLLSVFYLDDGTYDPDWLRMEHILANNMVIFKDDKLDPEVRDYFIKETKLLMDVIEKFKARKLFKFKQLIWGTIFRILSRTSIVDGFSTAGLSHDYDTLQLLTNGLIKNKLYYHAARLKNI